MSPSARIVYAVILMSAVLIAWGVLQRRQRSLSLTRPERWTVGIAAFLGASIGSKLPFLAEQGWDGFRSGTVWFADGKTILGGIVGGYFAVEVAKWAFGIRTRTGDTFAVPIAIAVCVGRLGCFIGGCCFGTATNLPWGVDFGIANDPPGTLRHPTQIYEMAFHGTAAIWLLWADRKRWFVGNQLKIYLLAYFAYRFLSECLRPESIVSTRIARIGRLVDHFVGCSRSSDRKRTNGRNRH
jgi:phosphatidylglycerol---prolipoprotein diacylglyceryl transferase